MIIIVKMIKIITIIISINILIYNLSYSNELDIDLSTIVSVISSDDKSECHGFFIDNHTVVFAKNCINNNNIGTIKRYTKNIYNEGENKIGYTKQYYIISEYGLKLKSLLISNNKNELSLISTKKSIVSTKKVYFEEKNQNIIIPVKIDEKLLPIGFLIKNNKISIPSDLELPKDSTCKIISGTPILSQNKKTYLVDIIKKTINCADIENYKIEHKKLIENLNYIYNCFTKINNQSDIYHNKYICNFRYSS